MNIALTGVTGVWNRGVQALVDTSATEIRRLWPDATITVLTSDLERDRRELPARVTAINDASRYFKLPKALRPAVGQVLGAAGMGKGRGGGAVKALKTLKDADIAIALGGDIFSSDYGSDSLKRHVATIEEAQANGTPTVFLAQSIGPFTSEADVATMRGALDRSSLLTVRERLTQDYMASAFKLGPERAVLTADIAFLLEPSAPERAEAILAHLGLEPGKFVAMSASQGITTFSTLGGDDAHDNAWIEAIETVLRTTDHSVLIVPHVQAPLPANNDARIAFRLIEKLNFNPRVKAAFGPYTASDFKALIARSRFLIGERMHACIAALSSGVPLIAVGYSIKARGIMGDVFGEKAEEYGLIVPVKTFVEPGKIAGMIASVEDNIGPIRSVLAAELPRVKARARDNFTRLATLGDRKREKRA